MNNKKGQVSLIFISVFLAQIFMSHSISSCEVVYDFGHSMHLGYNNSSMPTNGELLVLNFIESGDVVFDVGANKGEWTSAVLSHCTPSMMYLFEPIPEMCKRLGQLRHNKALEVHQYALDEENRTRDFLWYSANEEVSQLSTFYHRPILSTLFKQAPQHINVTCITLDAFCDLRGINHINFLKIDTEGAELNVLKGAQRLLSEQKIDFIQFEYGGTYKDAGITLQEVYSLLTGYGYTIFRIFEGGLIHIPSWHDDLETMKYSNYLAVNKVKSLSFIKT